jgi:hypothetical protein
MKEKLISLIVGLSFILFGSGLFAADGDLRVNGNVGIGTPPNPNAKLQVIGKTLLGNGVAGGGNYSTGVGDWSTDYVPSGGNWNYTFLLNGLNTSSIGFHDAGHSVGSIRYTGNLFTIGGNDGWGNANVYFPGYVGIGGVSGGKFQVFDALSTVTSGIGTVTAEDTSSLAANVGGGIVFRGTYLSGGGGAGLGGIKAGKTNATSGNLDAYLAFYSRSNSSGITEKMRIDPDGKVGIGTTTPPSKLAVPGLYDGSGDNFYWLAYDNTTGKIWRVGSSASKYKGNIEPYSDNFMDILKLEPKSFTWNTDSRLDFGYIADEVDAVGLRNLIMYDEEGKPDGIKFARLPVYIIEVLKQQQSSLKSLQETLSAQQKTIETLKADLAAIKR